MTRAIVPLIMCGGAGTRLWPASRESRPKQFLPLFGPLSTFQETMRRVVRSGVVRPADHRHQRPVSVSWSPSSSPRSGSRRTFCSNRCGAIPVRRSLPAPRYALQSRRRSRRRRARRRSRGHRSARLSPRRAPRPARPPQNDRIVMFGVRADARRRPSTATSVLGGRLRRACLRSRNSSRSRMPKTAERYVAEGYLWNSGNFMFRAGLLLDEFRRFEPDSAAPSSSSGYEAPAPISASSHSMLKRSRARPRSRSTMR